MKHAMVAVGTEIHTMSEMNFEAQLRTFRSRVDPLERVVHTLARDLPEPIRYHSGILDHGFRYLKPNVEHFCLLKAVRAVSALNAALELARCGYTQEIAVLMRTLFESTTHIEFVLSARDDADSLEPEAAKYVKEYFADFARNSSADFRRAQVKQKTVNERLGREYPIANAEQTDSDVYRTFSNYLHGKYPEVMDLYGGKPTYFHLRGMRGTPKDAENIDMLDTFVTTVSLAFKLMVIKLKLFHLFARDPVIAEWFRSTKDLRIAEGM